ncbi:TIGR00725 family protein [Dactylosporangium sp. NBC_01737]|uniref:TIGR00725 family protein n=1 Tax=Dactylosporangium sp. NBC_01737 TaxID=2975959 RepID=UPI002E0FE2F4|nr:TIGR00725 family protein [Dactylosporangium sp. NBC_01737]
MGGAYVAVIGAGQATPEQERVAERVGALLAEAGAVVLSGGRGGVMLASCRGAHERGGLTVGLLPGSDRADGNPYLTIALPTGMGELRNGLVARTADGLIAVGGGWGTLSEIGFAMRIGRPLVAVGSWTVARPAGGPSYPTVDSAEAAVSWVLRAVSR